MTKQPEALLLAKWLDLGDDPFDRRSAKELRRLHEVNQELLKAAKLFQDYMRFMDAQDDIKGMLAFAELVEVNAAAITKAEGDEK